GKLRYTVPQVWHVFGKILESDPIWAKSLMNSRNRSLYLNALPFDLASTVSSFTVSILEINLTGKIPYLEYWSRWYSVIRGLHPRKSEISYRRDHRDRRGT